MVDSSSSFQEQLLADAGLRRRRGPRDRPERGAEPDRGRLRLRRRSGRRRRRRPLSGSAPRSGRSRGPRRRRRPASASNCSWKELLESTIPTGWTEAAHILQRQQGVAAIVGDVDSGKSSLCTFLANMCVQNGLKVGVVDADVGQADIGPPTTISSSLASEPILTLQDLRQETAFFIGDTSPSSVPDKLTRLIVRLKEKLVSSSELVLVNTDGWIGDLPALRFKEELLHETQPDLVLGLSRGSEIDPLLDMVSSASIRLPSSTYARMRSREERKSARETGYRRFLLGSKTMKISQENTKLRMFDRSE